MGSTDLVSAPAHTDPLPFRHPVDWKQSTSRKIRFFGQPTHVVFRDDAKGLEYHWNSRAHRKGRMPLAKTRTNASDGNKAGGERKYARPRFFGFDLRDISWWIAQLFLVGSIFWSANGILSFCYFSDTSDHIFLSEAVTAFVGGTTFIIGAYLSYVESLNPARDTQFLWEVDQEARRLVEPHKSRGPLGPGRTHFGRHTGVDGAGHNPDVEHSTHDVQGAEKQGPPAWRWFGTEWHSFGFVANLIQLYGATIFWIAVLTGLPGVLPKSGASSGGGLPAESLGLWVGLYWTPQILGAPGFFISGFMFMYEVQPRWWIPKLNSLGWHVGFWNMVGGFGFWFCGIFGVLRETGGSEATQKWGTAFSTFWGSWAFLIGSYVQLYEGLNKR